MKLRIVLLLVFILDCLAIWSQDDFSKGVIAAHNHKFVLADSLFSNYLRTNPRDANAAFNLANVKLQLGDTCLFCNLMYTTAMHTRDKEAWKLFAKTCGKFDTLYYNEKFELTTDKKYRYLVESIPSFCDKTYIVNIHDRKRSAASSVTTMDLFSSYTTNIIASYRLGADGSKIYLFIEKSRPAFPGGDEKRDLYKQLSADVHQAREELSLYHVVVSVVYVIDKSGVVRDVTIKNISGEIKDDATRNKLIQYVTSYFMNMPHHIPAKFRDENVDFQVEDQISFW